MPLFTPERYFSRLSHIDIERDLLARGKSNVLLDIDNTILARDTHAIPRDAGMWMGRAREAGVNLCLVSNNWHESVHELAGRLELPLVAKSCKPLPHGFWLGMRKIGAQRANTVMVGDQLTTDVLGAHLAGLPAYLLRPLVDQDIRVTTLMRNVERVLLGERQPEPAPLGCEYAQAAESEEAYLGGA